MGLAGQTRKSLATARLRQLVHAQVMSIYVCHAHRRHKTTVSEVLNLLGTTNTALAMIVPFMVASLREGVPLQVSE